MFQKTLSTHLRAGLLAASLASLLPAAGLLADDPAPRPSPSPRSQPRVVLSPDARLAIEDCRRQGFEASRRSFLGIEATPISNELRRHFGASEGAGVLVARVVEGGPAARAGIAVGDVLVRCAGEQVAEPHDLRSAVKGRKNGEAVTVELIRDGKPRSVSVVLEEKETCAFDIGQVFDPQDFEKLRELGKLDELGKLGYLQALDGLDGLDLDIDLSELNLDELIKNAVGIAALGLEQALDSKDWARELAELQKGKAEELEKRMQEVARHLEQLERKLEAETSRYGEEARREMERAREELRRDLEQRKVEIDREVKRSLENTRREAEAARRAAEEDRRERAKSGGGGGGGEMI